MNYTVIFSQIGGPPSDARESSYKEVGEFILGPFESWFNSRIIDDGDQDNDGIRDWCDSDIDGDNLLNPIIGGDAQCPNSPVIGYEGWMIDENFDGVHDQVTDDDIDNDGILELLVSHGESRDQPLSLYKAKVNPQHKYLRIKPLNKYGAPARGATVTLISNLRKHSKTIDSGSGYLCQMEPVAHYGIRKNEKDIKIQIKWTNGKTKTISVKELNQTITLNQ